MVIDDLNGPKYYLGALIVAFILLFAIDKCAAQSRTAQIDTMSCNVSCIDRFVEEKTSKGTIKYYAIYNDIKNDISELIPVSQNVMSYIKLCNANNIRPSLGIKLKNGQISSLIKYKSKYIRRK